jgi:hypothetical protein
MTFLQKKLTVVIAAVVLSLTLGLVSASGLGPALLARLQAPAGGAVTEPGMAGGSSTTGDVGRAQAAVKPAEPASTDEEPTIPLEERRARWFNLIYEGRTFEVSEGPPRHPEP